MSFYVNEICAMHFMFHFIFIFIFSVSLSSFLHFFFFFNSFSRFISQHWPYAEHDTDRKKFVFFLFRCIDVISKRNAMCFHSQQYDGINGVWKCRRWMKKYVAARNIEQITEFQRNEIGSYLSLSLSLVKLIDKNRAQGNVACVFLRWKLILDHFLLWLNQFVMLDVFNKICLMERTCILWTNIEFLYNWPHMHSLYVKCVILGPCVAQHLQW